MRLLLHHIRIEQLLFWRNREAAIFVFIFPPLLYLLLGAVYDGEIDGRPAADVLIAGLIGYGCVNTTFGGLAITQVIRRENGLVKRLRGTPLPAWAYLVAVVVSVLITFVAQMVVTVALGIGFYGAEGPARPFELLALVLFAGLAFAGLGFGATTLMRSAEGSSAVVNLAILPMAFLSGAFGPTRDYPQVLQWLADALPLTYLVRLLERVYLEDKSVLGDPTALAVIAAWGLAGYLLAWRRFRWVPRET